MSVRLGSDVLLASGRLAGKRVGIVCNHASLDRGFLHIVDRLAARPDLTLAAIFGPQHGFRSDVQDNMIETPHVDDAARGGPIYPLYSETREPTADMLAGLDVLVIDLQDIGARIYTYVYTMANCLRARAGLALPVLVCDRPNPIGGDAVEGASLDPAYASFVGQFPIPMRHGLTIGEAARLVNEHFGLHARLDVVPMDGWRRGMYFDETGLPWVLPSPNIPTLDTAIVYPGGVLFEGTLLSEGRGTTKPFELIGAPWIDGDRFADAMNARGLPGVRFRPVFFEPTFHKQANTACGGCQIHVIDRAAFLPYRTGVEMIAEFRQQSPSTPIWRDPPYEYEYTRPPIDILYGSDRLRRAIDAGEGAALVTRDWARDEDAFRELRRQYLLY